MRRASGFTNQQARDGLVERPSLHRHARGSAGPRRRAGESIRRRRQLRLGRSAAADAYAKAVTRPRTIGLSVCHERDGPDSADPTIAIDEFVVDYAGIARRAAEEQQRRFSLARKAGVNRTADWTASGWTTVLAVVVGCCISELRSHAGSCART
jgi:hypothetical protein